MSATALKEHGVIHSVSDEARQRINDARVSELAFDLQNLASTVNLTRDDARQLARIVLEGMDRGQRVDRDYVYTSLLSSSRSPERANILADMLFK